MNIWRSMPTLFVQTQRSHWSTWQGKLHSSRSYNVNCCYGHSRESRAQDTYFSPFVTKGRLYPSHKQPVTAAKLHFPTRWGGRSKLIPFGKICINCGSSQYAQAVHHFWGYPFVLIRVCSILQKFDGQDDIISALKAFQKRAGDKAGDFP